jgi:hypothetical protein
MRKVLVTVLLLVLCSSLSAQTLGYGVGFYGQNVEAEPERASSGAEVSLVYKPLLLPYLNPSMHVKTSVGTEMDGEWVAPYWEVGMTVDLIRIINHPFNFLAHNIIAYTPSVSVAYQYDPRRDLSLASVGFSPFKLSQKDFWYEFFSPFLTMTFPVGHWTVGCESGAIHLFFK